MKKNKNLAFLLILPLIIISHPTIAKDTLQKIEITAGETKNERRKNQEKMFYKPYSKHIVGEKTIQEESFSDIAEAVRDIPGVNITESGSFHKTIKIRGLQGPRVVSLINGIKLSNQGMTHTGAGETGMADIANVKTIEVIKGSPSVIFDPGASGGVINIITHKAPLEKGIGIKQRLSYDEGYDKKKSTTILDVSTGNIGARFSYSRTESNDYKIKGNRNKKLAISSANIANAESPNFLEIKNLGYSSEAVSARISAKVGEDGIIDLDWQNWTGKDMSLIHGPSIIESTIIQFERMDRNSHAISYRKDNLGIFSDLHLKYAKQYQYQAIGENAIGVKLKSEQVNLISDLEFENSIIKTGFSVIKDEATTLVYSTQDYYGAFANLEYLTDKWTFFGGVRWNRWTTTQKLRSATNRELAKNLVGISGITPSKTTSAPTVAVGIQYLINQQNNISLNFNTTYRNPDLMERYSFSNTLGGGLKMQPEEGKHAEISWKHLSPKLSMTTSVFYSKFKNYIWTKSIRKLKNQAALEQCIRVGLCNPKIGEFNDRETDFYDIFHKYYNSPDVTNFGVEFNAEYSIPQHEVIFGSSFNQINSNDAHVKSAAHPVDTNISYRYEFNNDWKPWLKIEGQYVLDFPKVKQHMGFDPYFLASFYAGFNKNNFIVSGGVRNLLDKEYHAPYSGINGLSRTFFVNVAYEWHSAND